jgi:hypothetical protein
MYQLASGQRREIGKQNWKSILQYLKKKYERIANMPCKSCGGHSIPPPIKKIYPDSQPQSSPMSDEAYLLTEYTHPNRGQHQVTGAITRTNYGYRSGGEKFLVHRDDIQAQPMYFRVVQLDNIPVPKSEIQAPPPPPNVAPAPEPPAPVVEAVPEQAEEVQTESIPRDLLAESEAAPPKIIGEYDVIDLDTIPGVTSPIAKAMIENGMTTARAIMDSGLEGLQTLKGVGPNRAQVILDVVAKKVGL